MDWRFRFSPDLAGARRIGMLVGLLPAVWVAEGWAQQVIRVSSAPCAGCTIERRAVLTIAGLDEPNVGPYTAVAHDSRGRWLLGTMDKSPGNVAVYDSSGAFLRRFGRKGEGPGELQGVGVMVATRGDTVHVFDNYLRRHTVFSPTYQYLRSSALPGYVLDAVELSDGSLVVNADFPRPNSVGLPLHKLDAAGRIVHSFGAEVPVYRSDATYLLNRALSVAEGNRVWSAPGPRYEPGLWSLTEKVVEVRREVAWFPPQISVVSPGRAQRPSPWVTGVWSEGGQRLWIKLQVPDANWRPRPQEVIAMGERAPPIEWDREYDTIVEVIDIRTGQLLASQRFDQYLRYLLPGGYAVHYREDALGEPFLDVWQLHFVTSARR